VLVRDVVVPRSPVFEGVSVDAEPTPAGICVWRGEVKGSVGFGDGRTFMLL
jgi:hypothetical protein